MPGIDYFDEEYPFSAFFLSQPPEQSHMKFDTSHWDVQFHLWQYFFRRQLRYINQAIMANKTFYKNFMNSLDQ